MNKPSDARAELEATLHRLAHLLRQGATRDAEAVAARARQSFPLSGELVRRHPTSAGHEVYFHRNAVLEANPALGAAIDKQFFNPLEIFLPNLLTELRFLDKCSATTLKSCKIVEGNEITCGPTL